jgi:hypothetical protein
MFSQQIGIPGDSSRLGALRSIEAERLPDHDQFNVMFGHESHKGSHVLLS